MSINLKKKREKSVKQSPNAKAIYSSQWREGFLEKKLPYAEV